MLDSAGVAVDLKNAAGELGTDFNHVPINWDDTELPDWCDHISCQLSDNNQIRITVDMTQAPRSYKEAMARADKEKWLEAMRIESET